MLVPNLIVINYPKPTSGVNALTQPIRHCGESRGKAHRDSAVAVWERGGIGAGAAGKYVERQNESEIFRIFSNAVLSL
jgi:hypothetical protein